MCTQLHKCVHKITFFISPTSTIPPPKYLLISIPILKFSSSSLLSFFFSSRMIWLWCEMSSVLHYITRLATKRTIIHSPDKVVELTSLFFLIFFFFSSSSSLLLSSLLSAEECEQNAKWDSPSQNKMMLLVSVSRDGTKKKD